MAQGLTRLRGFQDLIGPSADLVTEIERRWRSVAERHNFHEIRLPLLERVELYQRTSGETSDIVEKQMYVFADRDEEQTMVALRPEGTAGAARAYIDAGFDRSDPEQRFYYTGPMFRRERPQKGRYRQHHQFGVEIFGRPDPAADAELLIMIAELQRELGLEFRFEINSIGDAQCRPQFREAVYQFGKAHLAELCEDCKRRLEQNPLRLLDCKIDAKLAESAPKSSDYLCDPCKEHFAQVKQMAEKAGVELTENPRLVRGLDYYNRTTFEVIASGLGAQSTVVAGGRYDGLVELLGGKPSPGIGFGSGLERLMLAMEAASPHPSEIIDAAVIGVGDKIELATPYVALQLTSKNLRVETMSTKRSLRALLSRANKIGARYAVIVDDEGLQTDEFILRDLRASTQKRVEIGKLADEIKPGK